MLESGLVPYLNQASQSQESVAEILRIVLRDLAEQAPLPGDLQERSRRISAALLARSAASLEEADKAAEELSPLTSSQSALQQQLSDISQIRGSLEAEQRRYYYTGSGITGSGRIIHNPGMYQRLEGQIEEQRRWESEVWNNLRRLGEQRSRIDSAIAAARQASSVHEALSKATLGMAGLLAGSRCDSRAVMDALEGLIISGHLASEAKNAAEVLLNVISGSRSLAR